MRILLTGGLGGIGRWLTRWLAQAGHTLRVLDRAPHADLPHAEYSPCDVTDYAALRRQMEGMEAVVHLAAIISPARGLAQDIFDVNGRGTFNAYQAAVEAGVRRFINFSSINTLGYNFGVKPAPIHYFPIDEDHPSFTTDPYSFSKTIGEQIGEYFWRRDGFSSLSLRPCGVVDPEVYRPEQLRQFIAGLNQVLQALVERPQAERRAIARRALELFDATRARRALPGAIDNLAERTLDLAAQSPDAAAAGFTHGGHSDFWTIVDVRDVCQAVEKGLNAELAGHHALLITDSHNLAGIESELLADTFFPEATRRVRPLQGTESLVSIERARALIGYEPAHSVRQLYPR